MHGSTITQVEEQLKVALGPEMLCETARASRFERRTSRAITPVKFVCSLLHSLGTRKIESLADLHRDFNAAHATHVNYKPYYERMDTPGFAEMMRMTFESLMSHAFMGSVPNFLDFPSNRH